MAVNLEIRIGTTTDQLESFVNSQTNLSEKAKTSIFNYIYEEERYGDHRITDEAELAIVKSFFADEKPGFLRKLFDKKENEQIPVEMPHIDPNADGVEIAEYEQYGLDVERRVQEKDGITYTESIHKLDGEVQFTSFYTSKCNTLHDRNGDGIVDERTYKYEDSDSQPNYVRKEIFEFQDKNMDGSFDIQYFTNVVGPSEYDRDFYKYERDTNGKSWGDYEKLGSYRIDPDTGKLVIKKEVKKEE